MILLLIRHSACNPTGIIVMHYSNELPAPATRCPCCGRCMLLLPSVISMRCQSQWRTPSSRRQKTTGTKHCIRALARKGRRSTGIPSAMPPWQTLRRMICRAECSCKISSEQSFLYISHGSASAGLSCLSFLCLLKSVSCPQCTHVQTQ